MSDQEQNSIMNEQYSIAAQSENSYSTVVPQSNPIVVQPQEEDPYHRTQNLLPNQKSLKFVITIFGPSAQIHDALQLVKQQHVQISYLGWGNHICPTTNRAHTHVILILSCAYKYQSVQKWFTSVGLTPPCVFGMKGTFEQAKTYAAGEGHYESLGEEPKGQGTRSDLTLKEKLDQIPDLKTFIKEYPQTYCHLRNGLIDIYNQKRVEAGKQAPYVVWLAGPTGCGKTRLATEWAVANGLQGTWQSSILPWFNGYIGQDVAILDDLRATSIPFNKLLQLLDRYPVQAEVKGGDTWFNPKVIIITSPKIPNQTFVFRDKYHNGDLTIYEDVDQVNRRCHEIREWKTVGGVGQWFYHKGQTGIPVIDIETVNLFEDLSQK